MRCKSQCKAYQCNNGAPYGNALGGGSLAAVADDLAIGECEGSAFMEHMWCTEQCTEDHSLPHHEGIERAY